MRWATLYARSRQLPMSVAATLISALAVVALADGGDEPVSPRLPLLVIAAGATAASVGFGGQDVALDRTAAVSWVVRRAAHVLVMGAVVGTVLLAAQTVGDDLATPAFVVRDSAGLMGLAALGAALCGAQFAWTLPMAWAALALFAPPPTGPAGPAMEVATWPLLPPGTAAGTWTALTLAAVGTATYAWAGPKR